jgi:hypothetical protein
MPRRLKSKELRTGEHLTAPEVEMLIEAAKDNRHGHRDATMILIAFSTACGRRSFVISDGNRSILKPPPSMSAESRTAPEVPAFGPRMVRTRCGIVGADVRPN